LKEARKPYSVILLVDVFGLVLFRKSASQSIAFFIIIFLKEKSKELSGYMRNFFYYSLPGIFNSVRQIKYGGLVVVFCANLWLYSTS